MASCPLPSARRPKDTVLQTVSAGPPRTASRLRTCCRNFCLDSCFRFAMFSLRLMSSLGDFPYGSAHIHTQGHSIKPGARGMSICSRSLCRSFKSSRRRSTAADDGFSSCGCPGGPCVPWGSFAPSHKWEARAPASLWDFGGLKGCLTEPLVLAPAAASAAGLFRPDSASWTSARETQTSNPGRPHTSCTSVSRQPRHRENGQPLRNPMKSASVNSFPSSDCHCRGSKPKGRRVCSHPLAAFFPIGIHQLGLKDIHCDAHKVLSTSFWH